MGGTCSTHREIKNPHKIVLRNPGCENITMNPEGVRMWSGLKWLRVDVSRCILGLRKWTFEFRKTGNSWPAEGVQLSEVLVLCME